MSAELIVSTLYTDEDGTRREYVDSWPEETQFSGQVLRDGARWNPGLIEWDGDKTIVMRVQNGMAVYEVTKYVQWHDVYEAKRIYSEWKMAAGGSQ